MPADAALALACLLIAALVTWPVLEAWRRRRLSREASEVATALIEIADSLRNVPGTKPPDHALVARLHRLGLQEAITFEFAQAGRATPALLADTAQRLALRLKRRVAFERKMLARTAPGRRRGAMAAAAPGVTLLGLRMADVMLPVPALAMLIAVEAFGCWLLWRVARVEV
jgi:hypothetical protein